MTTRKRVYILRAMGAGLLTMLTALAMYERPPDLAAYWQPLLQGVIVALGQLGLNQATRGR